MIQITPQIAVDEDELRFSFVRSSGPGGQNVNKVSTAVQLRFDAAHSASLPDDVRARLLRLAGRRATAAGEVVINAQRFRTQEQNRQDAIARLSALIEKAAFVPKRRRPTRPSAASGRKRIEKKRQRGETKQFRKPVSGEE